MNIMPQKKTIPKKRTPVVKKAALPKSGGNWLKKPYTWLKQRRLWQQILLGLLVILMLFMAFMYSIATWYRLEHQNEPLNLGVSFSSSYAQSMGLDPHETLEAILRDIKPSQVRLVSYWSEHEPEPGKYDFTDLDWQFALLQKYNVKASLSVGLRQPRWPECHFPTWAANENEAQITQPLANYIATVVERYRSSPILGEYQLENEYFLKVFGTCQNFRSRERLTSEYNLVKKLDPSHPVVVSRSNNALGFPVNGPIPDISAVSVYKRVWDKTITHRYFEYPFPGWFYGSLAGIMQLLHGKPTIIHELQAEPWPPSGEIIQNSIAEQNKSMDAKRLKTRADYAISSGIRTIDFWGAEWWYWRLTKANDPTVWQSATTIFNDARIANQKQAADLKK